VRIGDGKNNDLSPVGDESTKARRTHSESSKTGRTLFEVAEKAALEKAETKQASAEEKHRRTKAKHDALKKRKETRKALGQHTKTGQPVLKNRIKHMLGKLMAEHKSTD
jgi:hypothetical protein